MTVNEISGKQSFRKREKTLFRNVCKMAVKKRIHKDRRLYQEIRGNDNKKQDSDRPKLARN